jgi:hypothetical protein
MPAAPLVAAGLVGVAAVLGLSAVVTGGRRRRTLIIERRGAQVYLLVVGARLEFEFPIALHGGYKIREEQRKPCFEIELQLVDRQGRALTLHETSVSAPASWFADAVLSVIPSPRFDVLSVTTTEIRRWIEALNLGSFRG